MKEIDNKYQIARLLSKDRMDFLTAEESKILKDWISESEENKILYEKIKEGRQQLLRDEFVNSIDVKTAWKKVQFEITPSKRGVELKQWALRVAAIFVIGMFVSIGYYISTTFNQSGNQKVADSLIVPGSKKAILQLHNGGFVQLEKNNNDSIIEIDGTLINNRNGKLEYLTQDTTGNQLKPLINKIRIPVGGEYQLKLSDGTTVWLNSDSEIEYPVNFIGNTRKVQVKGEVYFSVVKNKTKPFIVNVMDVEVEVLGTEFNIEAYQETESVVTTLVEGSVKLKKAGENIVIKPNQQASIKTNENIFTVQNVDARNYALWKDGVFYFKEASIVEIMEKLERWYGIKVFYENTTVRAKKFSVEVKRYDDIERILDILAATNKVQFKIKEKVVIVK